ncbi:low temperature requirement protein A [Yinghuangia soli]|uniref:Low temperature requirement protein A n=1 Tax=Yinghuangia soli TaxID=2908204 RepID=A0AA41U2R3_9ACTN|nr:low temperature requirement protein A [Yinghuangia soli]MCF2527369.1 low temperature requirement protein A [Yinghuangia soli]
MIPEAAASGAAGPHAVHHGSELRVSPLELFFDLVFVFTVMQLGDSLAHHLDAGGLARVLVILAVIWWMYDAFIWLSNAMPPSNHRRRGLHLLGMGAFLVIALTIPHAFDGSGVAFGWAYLAIVVLHTGMFAASGVPAGPVLRMGGLNLLGGGLVTLGGYVEGRPQLVLWALAFALQFAIPRLVDLPVFRLQAPHFVERHGLVVIVAFGETVLAIGIGAGDARLTAPLLVSALLSLAVLVGLWWAYFGHGDDEHCADFLASLDDARRNRLAVRLYNLAHYFLLLGVLLTAVGAKSVVAHPADTIGTAPAAALAGGVVVFLLANAAIRGSVGLTPHTPRLIGAAAVAATVPLGTEGSALAQVAGAALVLAAVFAYEETATRGTADAADAAGSAGIADAAARNA